jgi:hypothetical protein
VNDRHDTPVDLVPVTSFPSDDGQTGTLELIRAVETLEPAFDAWLEFRETHLRRLAQLVAEERQLDEQGELLMGAARRTQEGTEALMVNPLMARARAQLAAARAHELASHAQINAQIRATLIERVAGRAERSPPLVTLMVRALPGERRILHLARPSGDDAVLLLYAFTQRIPSRYGSLFDDSTDDSLVAPSTLYAEEGCTDTRSTAATLAGMLLPLTGVWPVKGAIPVLEAPMMRWVTRGAVLEAEIADGETWRNLLTRDEAEVITARLLNAKLAGAIDFELGRG